MTSGTLTQKSQNIKCRIHFRKINSPANLPALSQIFSQLKSSSILGANSSCSDAGRFSYWAAEPIDILEFTGDQENPFPKLQKALNKYRLEDSRRNLPKGMFCGGWIGYFSYELARYIEKLPVTTIDDLKMPLIRLCFYDKLIACDHIDKSLILIALEIESDTKSPGTKLDELESLLNKSQKIKVNPPVSVSFEDGDFSNLKCNMDKDYYLKSLAKIKKYIFDGDVYQINFSRRFEYPYNAAPVDLFHWQNRYNPSPYSAYIDCGDFYIVSASPEMFITVVDETISTKPIKGTRPRFDQPNTEKINEKNFNELACSEKEQAELNMIIDLERNDIAKICIPGTRKVIQPRTIESYPTVFHAVATIAGRLRYNTNFCDILKAVFPGGSITGAPKIRSMEIIDETEPTARGVYTGCIGFIGIDSNACLNIAIRTVIIKDQTAYAQTGGGIVADSDPEAEWQETIVKAKALLEGIIHVQNEKNLLK